MAIKLSVKIIFLVISLLVLSLPAAGLAAPSSYQLQFCKWDNNVKPPALDCQGVDQTTVYYEGFVPCGKPLHANSETGELKMVYCTFCHGFLLAQQMVNFVVITLAPVLIVFMIVLAGLFFFLGGARPSLLQKARTLLWSVVIGVALIYGAYFLVGEVLTLFKTTRHNPLQTVFQNGIFSVNCPIQVPEKDINPANQ
jgi:hypothetical protein